MKRIFAITILVLISVQYNFSFSQEQPEETKIGMNDNWLHAIVKNDSIKVTPYIFLDLKKISSGLYIFSVDPVYRGQLHALLDSIDIVLPMGQSEREVDFDDYPVFQGVIDSNGDLIGGEGLRMVEYIKNTDESPLFLVQSQQEYESFSNEYYALMNSQGVVLTDYYYEFISSNGERLQGHIVKDTSFQTVELNSNGEIQKVISERPR